MCIYPSASIRHLTVCQYCNRHTPVKIHIQPLYSWPQIHLVKIYDMSAHEWPCHIFQGHRAIYSIKQRRPENVGINANMVYIFWPPWQSSQYRKHTECVNKFSVVKIHLFNKSAQFCTVHFVDVSVFQNNANGQQPFGIIYAEMLRSTQYLSLVVHYAKSVHTAHIVTPYDVKTQKIQRWIVME